jgi:hypothetical protein
MSKRLLLAVVFSTFSATLASGQAPSGSVPAGFDSRWTPYLGCWRVAQEQLGQASVPVAPNLMVCVQPSGRAGVEITTTVDGKNVLEQTIVGDGTAQPLAQGDCQGTQISEWSRDGERLFTKVELHCGGRPVRTVSGITQMAQGHWVDAQATIVDGDSDVRVRRYRRTSDQYTHSPSPAGAPMSVEDVIEASKKVIGPVLEAALVEAGGRFSLNSRVLNQLADAGVSPNVIDLMVAQAYPDRFEVDRPSQYPSSLSAGAGYGTSTRSSSTNVFMGTSVYPYPYYDPFFNSYYYYSPFAYPYYWGSGYYPYRYGYPYGSRNYYNNYYYGYPGSIYSSGGGSIRSGGTAQPGSADSPGTGTVVATPRGYTRVRPSGSSGDSGGSSPRSGSVGGGRAVSGGDSGGGSSSSSSGGGNSSSSGGGGSSSSSSSSGGGGGGGGRTAQPR